MSGYTSIHTHTLFCDGEDDVETMCRSAFGRGLAAIGFSAHAPLGKAGMETAWHMRDDRLGEYVDEVLAARRRWEDKIAVYLGLEVDYIRGLSSALDDDITGLGLDYTIGSVHYIVPPHGRPWAGLFTVDGPLPEMEKDMRANLGGDGEALMNAYWDAVLEMVNLGGFDVVGHLDLVKKNNGKARWFSEDGDSYMQRAEEAVRAIASAGLVVEANTGGMNRGYLREPFPSPQILRLLRRHDVPVTISADAHRARDVDGHYREAGRFLREAGYAGHVVFEGRSGGRPIWREKTL
ncbi:MAG: histidinol-phosphatase [Treponema sp.]|nr:histidinol-phosphatase [Treponema sp.]